MSNEAIIAIASALCSLVGTFGGILASSKMTTYRIEQLEKKVEKHNNVIERQHALEEWAGIYDEKMKNVDKRLEKLEDNDIH